MADDPIAVHVHRHEPEPLSVSQRTCEKHTGLTPERFLALCRTGELPSKRAGHDRIVLLEDVRAWLARPRTVKAKPPTPAQLDEAAIMAAGGAKKAG